ncbi:hypothetical protein ACHAWF_004843 [Thalassiosira exigua]
MIDGALARIGVEVDWTDLDGPLRQVGSGIDAAKFGVVDRGGGEGGEAGGASVRPLTSRDWIFVKECVFGAPLVPPDAPAPQTAFVGRPPSKEFLYDVVNNRHSGLDVDKVDYYDRDSLCAYGHALGHLGIFLRDAAVAWGSCPNPATCFKCRRGGGDEGGGDRGEGGGKGSGSGDGKTEGKPDRGGRDHLMICYPRKHVASAMNFFATRMKNHETIYTHKKTKGSEFHMVDILLEADRHPEMMLSTQRDDAFAFPVPRRFADFKYKFLPISRAWMYPRLFLRVVDSIIDIVENKAIEHPNPEKFHHLRRLLNERRDHQFCKCVGEEEIVTNEDGTSAEDETLGAELWRMSEDELRADLLKEAGVHDCGGKLIKLEEEDIIVEKRTLHYGRGSDNPVRRMRFFDKADRASLSNPIDGLPVAVEVKNLPMNAPRTFLRRTIRIFSRKLEKHDLVTHSFLNWKAHRTQRLKDPNCDYKTYSGDGHEEEDDEFPNSEPQLLTQDDDPPSEQSSEEEEVASSPPSEKEDVASSPSRKRKESEKDENTPPGPTKQVPPPAALKKLRFGVNK